MILQIYRMHEHMRILRFHFVVLCYHSWSMLWVMFSHFCCGCIANVRRLIIHASDMITQCCHSRRGHYSRDLMIWPPSQPSPASSLVHSVTEPASTQIIVLYPSFGSKSPIPFAFSIHGFQTTVSLRLSRTTSKRGLPAATTEVVDCLRLW